MLGLRARTVGALLRKEAREVIRDRRTLVLTLVMPAIIYPLLMMTLAEVTAAATLSLKARPLTVALTPDVPEDVRTALERAERVVLKTSPDVEQLVTSRDVWVGLRMTPSKGEGADPGVKILFDKAADESRMGADRVEEILEKVREERLRYRIQKLGVTEAYLKPLPPDWQNTSSDERMRNYMASRLLPFLLIILSLVGASATAVDTTAGERERGTLLTLMSAPVRPGELAAAKLLIVAAVSLVAGLANMLSLGLSLASMMGATSQLQVDLTPRLILICTAALLPTTLYGAAMLLGLAALGKSTKEAQSAQAPALFISIGLAAVAVAPGVKSSVVLNALPIAGPALLMRDLMMQDATLTQTISVLCASVITLWLMVSFAARILTSEPMLSAHLSTAAVIKDLSGQRRPTTLTAALLSCAVMACLVVVGPILQGRDLTLGLLATQVLLFIVPVAILRGLHLDVRAIMGWRRPPLRMVVAAVLIGCTAFLPVGMAESVLLELSGMQEVAREMQQVLEALLRDQPTALHAVLLLGVVPAVFEEIAFRGAVQGVLQKVARPGAAVVIQALLFALAHQSVARFPPTFLLGLALGALRWRSGSLWPGILLHALNNGLLAGLTIMVPEAVQALEDSPASVWGPLLGADVLVLLTGLVLIWRQETIHDRAQ